MFIVYSANWRHYLLLQMNIKLLRSIFFQKKERFSIGYYLSRIATQEARENSRTIPKKLDPQPFPRARTQVNPSPQNPAQGRPHPSPKEGETFGMLGGSLPQKFHGATVKLQGVFSM